MDFNVLANYKSDNTIEITNSEAINIQGTIVGTLGSVTSTLTYMQNFRRYNNYLTSNYGAAQMAADRYMSLKERIPMSFEYYKTPTEKAEVVLYINPEKLSITTQKVIGKSFTRGGIYYNHYGDDHWTLTLHGTVGWAQMKGIEALEEVYHNSGTLLMYQNVAVDTVHTSKLSIYKSIQQKLSDLQNSSSPISKYFGKVIGTVTDALGMTGDKSNSLATKIFGKTASDKANGNLFQAITNSAGSAADGLNKALGINNMSGIGKAVQMGITNPEIFASVGNTFKSVLGGTTSKDVINALTGDVIASLGSGGASLNNLGNVLGNFSGGLESGLSSLLSALNGDAQGAIDAALPTRAMSGNYYTLGKICVSELSNIVKSVQNVNTSNTINKQVVAERVADIQDVLTDPYRPRQVFIYYDDRVYIGHFNSFNWNRDAKTHLLIYYDLKFTVTRQVILTKEQKMSTPSLGQALLGAAAGGLVNMISNKMAGSDKVSPSVDMSQGKGAD